MLPKVCGLTTDELGSWLEARGEKRFRAKQIMQWIYEKREWDPQNWSNVGASLRNLISENFSGPELELVRAQDSGDDETVKFLWKLADGKLVESVCIFSEDRRTLCVSSQIGCPARCSFCASGQKGFLRQLTRGEIVAQVMMVQRWPEERGEKLTNIVFMGMGEPLENTGEVIPAIRIITDPKMLGMSQRRITVSTVGVIEGIRELLAADLKVKLVLSLHAPNQRIRKKIIPYARRYELGEILTALDEYSMTTKRDITYEYILIAGVNDQPEHARELCEIARKRQCTVNLIPYNPVPGVNLTRPSGRAILTFRSVLDRAGIINTCRYTKGDDIAAACGQLAMAEENLLSA